MVTALSAVRAVASVAFVKEACKTYK